MENRPHSSASGSLLKQSGPQLISPMPEVKRNRGRPRKLKDPSIVNDDGKVYRVKRGRGRPRKNSLNSNLSNTQNSYLEEGKSTIFICRNKKNELQYLYLFRRFTIFDRR